MPDKKTRGVSNLANRIPDVPDAPTVSATNVGTSRAYNNGAATVSISSPTGGLPSSYSITTSPSTVTTTATSSPATISGLSSATSYTVTVTPSNVSATGASTTSSSFTATTVPQAPTIGAFTDGGTGTTGTLSFTAGATGGSSITGYTYSTDGTNYSAASGTTSPLSLTGLSVGTYTFYLKATNANGTSLASTGVSGTVIQPTAFESIASATGTGSSGVITFSSIPQTYKHLQIRAISRQNSSGSASQDGWFRFNGDTSTSNYYDHWVEATGAAVQAGDGGGGNAYTILHRMTQGSAAASNMMGVVIVDIHDYSSTSKNKTIRYFSGVEDNNTIYSTLDIGSGLWANTAAITSMTITIATDNYNTQSVFALYGIKGA